MLRQIGEHLVRGNGRHLVEPCFAELAFDIIGLGKAETAVGLEADIGRLPGRICSEHLRHIGFWPASTARFEQRCCLLNHQFSRTHIRIALGDGELDALVLADGPAEDVALIGISR